MTRSRSRSRSRFCASKSWTTSLAEQLRPEGVEGRGPGPELSKARASMVVDGPTVTSLEVPRSKSTSSHHDRVGAASWICLPHRRGLSQALFRLFACWSLFQPLFCGSFLRRNCAEFFRPRSMPQRGDLLSFPVVARSLLAHDIEVAVVEDKLDTVADRSTLKKPLIVERHAGSKSSCNNNFPLRVSMKTNATLWPVIKVPFGEEILCLSAKNARQPKPEGIETWHAFKRNDAAFPFLVGGGLGNLRKAQIVTSMLVDNASVHQGLSVPLERIELFACTFCVSFSKEHVNTVANDEHTRTVSNHLFRKPTESSVELHEFANIALRSELFVNCDKLLDRKPAFGEASKFLHANVVLCSIAKRNRDH
eukprot:Amastigsp_a842174_22.p1 type:complete len:365 gc:universal Amastigsp_a842174_22:80-1174(+)